MKNGLTLKLMLKGTAVCVLLTLIWYFFTRTRPRVDFFAEFELIALWGAVLLGWIVYLIRIVCKHRK